MSEGTVAVYGHGQEASCGIELDQSKSYLVCASRPGRGEGGSLQTGLCDSTKPPERAEDDLLVLGSPEDSLPGIGGCGVSPFDEAMTLVSVLALLAPAGALILRRTS